MKVKVSISIWHSGSLNSQ